MSMPARVNRSGWKPNALGGKVARLPVRDARIRRQLGELDRDSFVLSNSLPLLPPKVAIVGTARSSATPGENGYLDHQFGLDLGAELARREMVPGTGGGGGAMRWPLEGFTHAREQIAAGSMVAVPAAPVVRGLSWEADPHDLSTQGANIMLPHEQEANPFVDKLVTFERFLFRMEFLFRNTSEFVATPGGYGTLAEVFSFMALKARGEHQDPIVFGAPDDFFDVLNEAAAPMIEPELRADLENIHHDPVALVDSLVQNGRGIGLEEDPRAMVERMRAEVRGGLRKLDTLLEAVSFFGGEGPLAHQGARVVADLARRVAGAGGATRVFGSQVIDSAVKAGVQESSSTLPVQAFSLKGDQPGADGLDYHQVQDLLVLRELLSTRTQGLVITPDGAASLAMLYTLACDIQTGKLPPLPLVVVDPDGSFARFHEAVGKVMLSEDRRYINPADLDLITIVKSADEALLALGTGTSTTTTAAAS
jgi:predicted Rossmann-fold nucleotide-binding protein